jgi:hypothetical protein
MQASTPSFTFPSLTDLLAVRKGGKIMINIGICLLIIQLSLAAAFMSGFFILPDSLILSPIRITIACAWIFFLYSNYKSYMDGSRFLVMIDFAITAVFTFYLNTIYNKIVRQCFSSHDVIGICGEDHQYSFSTSWIILLSPIGLSVPPTRIFSLLGTILFSSKQFSFIHDGKGVVILEEIFVFLCGIHWPLYLDQSRYAFSLPFDHKWLYIGLYIQCIASIIFSVKRNDYTSYIDNVGKHLLLGWPGLVHFVFSESWQAIMFIPYIVILCRTLLNRLKQPAVINPAQDMVGAMMSNMMNQLHTATLQNNLGASLFNPQTIAAMQNMMATNSVHMQPRNLSARNQFMITSICHNCGAFDASVTCSQCSRAIYCDRTCMREHWNIHKEECEHDLD